MHENTYVGVGYENVTQIYDRQMQECSFKTIEVDQQKRSQAEKEERLLNSSLPKLPSIARSTPNFSKKLCIHELFEAQVVQTPDAVAAVLENQQLSYQELNQRANQLAYYLRSLGVGPEVIVGFCIQRSLEMLVGLLGILKAGGAYVPLDPAYPKERLAFMLEDARVSLVLTQQQQLKEIPFGKTKVVCLDADWEVIAQESQENPVNLTTDGNLAYVIYTSGSTGKPKGVMLQHESLVNFTLSASFEYALEVGDRVLQFASISFDAAVEEIFPSLTTGATLVLRTDAMLNSVPGFLQKCHDLKLTVLDLPTAFWHQVTAELSFSGLFLPNSVRLVIIGGESALPERLATWQKHVNPRVRLVNTYGPTEATVVATLCDLSGPKAVETTGRELPIGSAIHNVQTYVLDQHLQPVPVEVPGELYIGGVGLARGYLNRPDLTAEKFIPNLFSKEPGTRLYKTGDLVQYRPDGNIEFLGRIDYQEKIRGFRIELREIEAVLGQNPAVRETVVIIREDVPGQKRLVAYVVPNQNSSVVKGWESSYTSVPIPDEEVRENSFGKLVPLLRNYLQHKLPKYMVPSDFVLLETLPLTLNNKVDRRALPAPERTRPETAGTFVAPQTFVEEVVASIWAEVLGLEQVGIHDNFFELGGHSLQITQLFTQVQKTFQVELYLHDLLEVPTIAGLAKTIDRFGTASSTTITTKTSVDLDAEAVLDPTICPEKVPVERTCIFLTGATGFLGTFLLYELLLQTQADIYCLVRSPSTSLARKKLESKLESYSLWHEGFRSRINPVIGDLSQPLLGLTEDQFLVLASKFDIIYHNGALVNSIYPYSALKATNVLGTQEVLKLASLIKVKPVHFVSTLSVFPSLSYSGVELVQESDSLDHGQVLSNGYDQSKWVAEKLVSIARDRGLPVCIYRPGQISGHSQTGICNPDDLFFRMIRGCIQLGSFPCQDTAQDLTSVDYVSRAIVYLSRQKESLHKTFHLINPQTIDWNQLFNWCREFGYPLQQISYSKWQAKLLNIAVYSQENALYPLVSLFSQRGHYNCSAKVLEFDCQNTLDGLAGTSITCPIVDAKLFSTYLSYFIRSGLLNAPQIYV